MRVTNLVELTKKPKPKNLLKGNVCITKEEIAAVTPGSTVLLKVYDSSNNLVATSIFTDQQFHNGLTPWKKVNSQGRVLSTGQKIAF